MRGASGGHARTHARGRERCAREVRSGRGGASPSGHVFGWLAPIHLARLAGALVSHWGATLRTNPPACSGAMQTPQPSTAPCRDSRISFSSVPDPCANALPSCVISDSNSAKEMTPSPLLSTSLMIWLSSSCHKRTTDGHVWGGHFMEATFAAGAHTKSTMGRVCRRASRAVAAPS